MRTKNISSLMQIIILWKLNTYFEKKESEREKLQYQNLSLLNVQSNGTRPIKFSANDEMIVDGDCIISIRFNVNRSVIRRRWKLELCISMTDWLAEYFRKQKNKTLHSNVRSRNKKKNKPLSQNWYHSSTEAIIK